MDSNESNAIVMPVVSDLIPQKEAVAGVLCEKDDTESERLLPPINGGISKGPPKTNRKVQWNDTNGNKLAEVLEFQPSDVSDSDDDDDDDSESCFCSIM